MAGCEGSERCLIDALAAAKAGDREANYKLYEADISRDRAQELQFRCGQCALRMSMSLTRRQSNGPLGDLGVIKFGLRS